MKKTDLAEIHKPLLQQACDENKWILESCCMKKGFVYVRIRQPKIKEEIIGNSLVEFTCEPKEMNISRIIKRVKQHFGLEQFDKKECVPETCGFYDYVKMLDYCQKESNDKSLVKCSQLKFKNKP